MSIRSINIQQTLLARGISSSQQKTTQSLGQGGGKGIFWGSGRSGRGLGVQMTSVTHQYHGSLWVREVGEAVWGLITMRLRLINSQQIMAEVSEVCEED